MKDFIPTENYIETDVLILGSGAAGCGAALAARQEGVRVSLVDKGKLESSGCLGGGNDHFLAVLDSSEPFDREEDLIRFFNKPLSGFTESMISRWFQSMPILVEYLLSVGVEFVRKEGGGWLRTDGFGQPGAWWINIENGQLIKRRIAKDIRSRGVDVFDHIMITRLLVEQDHIAGALGFHVLTGDMYIFKAGSVVMAMGNGANRATTNSSGNPYNTWHSPFNTGAQIVLAYEAGVRIINLDMMQQATLIPKGFGSAGMHGISCVGAHEIDAAGTRFMGNYHPKMENGPRRNVILGTFQEILKGNGPPFYMDMRPCDAEEVEHLQTVLMPGDKATFTDYRLQAGIDFLRDPMEVEISELELGGMLLTNEDLSTNITDLYNGCVFYSFSGSMCSGYLAGIEAAEAARGGTLSNQTFEETIQAERESIFRPFLSKGDMNYRDFEKAIQQVMNYYMKFVRNQQGMELTLKKLALIEQHIEEISATNLHELTRIKESLILLEMCRLSTFASLQRRESGRTFYNRSDFPEPDPAFDRTLCLFKSKDGIGTEWLADRNGRAA
ncbi:MAG: FAD-binding protein [Deltaproteobacteria bacterium]|nr:FAD-binding protein [Deltaproteobacteria bacterium]